MRSVCCLFFLEFFQMSILTVSPVSFGVVEGLSLYVDYSVVVVDFSRNGFPLGSGKFYADGMSFIHAGILSVDGIQLLGGLLEFGWKSGCVDGVDFEVIL
jgi:hypothetical protein